MKYRPAGLRAGDLKIVPVMKLKNFRMRDAFATSRRIKCLTCVDDFTEECLTITIAFGISGVQVTHILDSIALFEAIPRR